MSFLYAGRKGGKGRRTPGDSRERLSSSMSLSLGGGTMMPSGALTLLRCMVLLSALFMVDTVLLLSLTIGSLRPMSSGRAGGACSEDGG